MLNRREEIIIVNKVIRDDPTKSDSAFLHPLSVVPRRFYELKQLSLTCLVHNRQGLTARFLFDSLWDYDLWPVYAVSTTGASLGRHVAKHLIELSSSV